MFAFRLVRPPELSFLADFLLSSKLPIIDSESPPIIVFLRLNFFFFLLPVPEGLDATLKLSLNSKVSPMDGARIDNFLSKPLAPVADLVIFIDLWCRSWKEMFRLLLRLGTA